MKINIEDKITKYKMILLNFLIFMGVYGIWITNKHFATDTYNVYFYGMTGVNLANGRIIHWIIYRILELINFRVWENTYVTQFVLCTTISVVAYKVYMCFYDLSEKDWISALIIEIVSVMFFANIAYAEGWFYFPETCFGAAISTLVTYMAFFCFVKFYKIKNKKDLILSFLLLNISLMMYQVYIEVFVPLCLLYILCNLEQNKVKENIISVIEVIVLGGIASINSILVLKGLQVLGVASQTSRTGSLSIALICNNLVTLFKAQKGIWLNFNGYLSVMAMLSIIVLVVFCVVMILKKENKLINKILVVLVIGISYGIVFAPNAVSTSITLVPRVLYGFFVVTIGMALVGCVTSSNKMSKMIIATLLFGCFAGNYCSIQDMITDNLAINRLDQEQYIAIEHYIKDYEAETGNTVEYIATHSDDYKRRGYDSISYTIGDTNIRAMTVSWSDVCALNYYTGKNYIEMEMSEEEKEKYFGTENYDQFDLDKQVKIDGNTAYILVY